MKKIFIFGNGNLSFNDFIRHYVPVLENVYALLETEFILSDFRGTDTLAMEWLKSKTPNVTIFSVGDKAHYLPDQFNTFVPDWKLKNGFEHHTQRDTALVNACTHFLAIDFNSDQVRTSATNKSIRKCLQFNKIQLIPELFNH